MAYLKMLDQDAISAIRSEKEKPLDGASLRSKLAHAVSDQDLANLTKQVEEKKERLEGFGDWFMKHPILHTLGIAVLFGLGTDIYHAAKYILLGGKAPWETGQNGLVSRVIKKVNDIRNNNDKGPPEGPSATGGGGGSTQESKSAEEVGSTAERQQLDPVLSQIYGALEASPSLPTTAGEIAALPTHAGIQGIQTLIPTMPGQFVLPQTLPAFEMPVFRMPVMRPVPVMAVP
jgi:hypothetical protein